MNLQKRMFCNTASKSPWGILLVVLVACALSGAGIIMQQHRKHPLIKSIETSNWQTYTDPSSGISFKFVGDVPTEDVNTGSIEYGRSTQDYQYGLNNMENSNPTDHVYMAIEYPPDFNSHFFVGYQPKTLIDLSNKTSLLQDANGPYTYRLEVETKFAILIQCTGSKCSKVIRLKNNAHPYAVVTINGEGGERYGGAPINSDSTEFKTLEAVMKTFSLDPKQPAAPSPMNVDNTQTIKASGLIVSIDAANDRVVLANYLKQNADSTDAPTSQNVTIVIPADTTMLGQQGRKVTIADLKTNDWIVVSYGKDGSTISSVFDSNL